MFSITQSKVELGTERREAVINYRVRDLPVFLEQLRTEGIEIEKVEDFDYGLFAWIKAPREIKLSSINRSIDAACGTERRLWNPQN